ncbi:MAG: hypothetical protein ACI4QZ_02555 [Eubacteriales bacterium]
MTEEYRRQLCARITRLNETDYLYIKRIVKISFLCLFALFCGALVAGLIPCDAETLDALCEAHFCAFFDGLGPLDAVRSAVRFALPDLLCIFAVAFFGYTMLAFAGSTVCIFFCGARLGYCFFSLLPAANHIENGTFAFVFFAVCKLLVLIALVFAASEAEGFSYVCRDIYGKRRFALLSEKSVRYIVLMTSTAGFTALINVIYLIFLHFQKFQMI